MKLIFKPSKRKNIMMPVKLRFFNTSKFPKRSKAEWKLINKNPFGDTDGDGVKNFFDCKPLNKKKQGFEHQYTFSGNKQIRTVKMPPNMFLETTWADTQRSIEKSKKYDKEHNIVAKYKYQYEDTDYEGYKKDFSRKVKAMKEIAAKIKSKEDHVPVPFLEFDKEGLNIGHEGRHTSVAAMKSKLKYIPVTLEYPEGSKLPPEYEKLKSIKGKQFSDYDDAYHEDSKTARKRTAIEVEDLQDENDNQIPDKAESVNLNNPEWKDED